MLVDKLQEDLNKALKEKKDVEVSTLRMVISGVNNAKIAKGEELTDDEVLAEIAKDAKRHKESIAAYEAGSRGDLVDREKAELDVLLGYLPKQLSREDVGKLVDEAIVETGASSLADMGRVMSSVMARAKGQVDGAVVSGMVKEKLSGANG